MIVVNRAIDLVCTVGRTLKSGTKVTLRGRWMSDPDVRLTAWVHGDVQGVGFRWWTRCRALERGLTGYAANQADGRVLVVAQGTREAGEKLLAAAGRRRAGLKTGPGRQGRARMVAAGRAVHRFRRALKPITSDSMWPL